MKQGRLQGIQPRRYQRKSYHGCKTQREIQSEIFNRIIEIQSSCIEIWSFLGFLKAGDTIRSRRRRLTIFDNELSISPPSHSSALRWQGSRLLRRQRNGSTPTRRRCFSSPISLSSISLQRKNNTETALLNLYILFYINIYHYKLK